ncbi:MAG TPA: hemin uptake protein HemP [Candidatus Tectomicrobia bacterium]|nr:hemin uptake protein HemP [Candidatus Tectomicrobia bacterium]
MRRPPDASPRAGRGPGDGAGADDAGRAGAPRIDSAALFRAAREIVIVHQGQEYRLRITRAEKLILTK